MLRNVSQSQQKFCLSVYSTLVNVVTKKGNFPFVHGKGRKPPYSTAASAAACHGSVTPSAVQSVLVVFFAIRILPLPGSVVSVIPDPTYLTSSFCTEIIFRQRPLFSPPGISHQQVQKKYQSIAFFPVRCNILFSTSRQRFEGRLSCKCGKKRTEVIR